jgi:hypothetical protein
LRFSFEPFEFDGLAEQLVALQCRPDQRDISLILVGSRVERR